MKYITALIAAGTLVVGCASNAEMSSAKTKNMSHVHIGHVMTGWKDTPNKAGFLPTARAEAEITIKHAGLAAQKLTDLDWMKMHTRHVIQTIDPEKIAEGPGLGYGVLKAAKGVAKHIELSASSADASDNVKKHAVHVSTTANNTVERTSEILAHAESVLQAASASDAAIHVQAMFELAQQLIEGADADGNGKITWHKGEGGIAVAEKHMGAMVKAEGI